MITRRGFLTAGTRIIFFTALGWLLKIDQRRTSFLRPPQVLRESEFLSKCIRCNRCLDACSQGVIWRVLPEESFASAGTPYLDFRSAYCDFCLECTNVCPTGAIQKPESDPVQIGLAEIDSNLCVAWQWQGCNRCVEACTYDAIILDHADRPIVDTDKCTGCGLCETVCDRSAKRWDVRAQGKGVTVRPIFEKAI